MSTVFLASDLHIGHKAICKYRPEFSTPEEHNGVLIDNVLSSVGKRDTLYLLGDVLFDREYAWFYDKLLKYCGNVHLILGNHCSENLERQEIIRHAILSGIRVHSLVSYKKSWLVHAPVHPQELRGKVCIHGHLHRKTIPDPRYFNACVEHTGWKPIEFKAIQEIFKGRGSYE